MMILTDFLITHKGIIKSVFRILGRAEILSNYFSYSFQIFAT